MKRTFTLLFVFIIAACAGSFAQIRTKAPVIEIPFDFYRNEIVVQVRVDGKGPVNLAYETRLPLVEVGGLSAKNLAAAAIDLSKISERFGAKSIT